MINLLPPAAKKSITREYWVRVCTTWSLLCAFTLACVAFVFIPVYVLIGVQVDAYETTASVASEKIADYENVTKGLIRASQEARTVIAYTNLPLVSEYLSTIEQLQGPNVSLESIVVARAETGIAPIQLSGVATDRQSLASFRDRLLADVRFTAVDLPIANLAKDKDIAFSLTITVASTTTP